jgi:hypothetical protein
VLAEICGITRWAVDKALARPRPDLRPALMCLGDGRLRAYLVQVPMPFLQVRNPEGDGSVIRLPIPPPEESRVESPVRRWQRNMK